MDDETRSSVGGTGVLTLLAMTLVAFIAPWPMVVAAGAFGLMLMGVAASRGIRNPRPRIVVRRAEVQR